MNANDDTRPLTDPLRQALHRDTRTMRELARLIGVDTSSLFRFRAGQHGLTAARLDRLAEVMGMELTKANDGLETARSL